MNHVNRERERESEGGRERVLNEDLTLETGTFGLALWIEPALHVTHETFERPDGRTEDVEGQVASSRPTHPGRLRFAFGEDPCRCERPGIWSSLRRRLVGSGFDLPTSSNQYVDQ